MNYRMKISLSFIAIAALSSIVAIAMDQYTTRHLLFREMKTEVKTIASSVASQIDGDLVKQIKTKEDEKLPAYEILRAELRKARNANRRSDIYIKFLYTIYPDPKDPHRFLFGVDPEESEKDVSHAGTEDPGATPDFLYDHLMEVYSLGRFVRDPWGVWMTGYAPLYDSQGNYVATLGADMGADWASKDLTRLLLYASLTFLITLSLAAIVAHIHSTRVTRSLRVLEAATEEIGKGDYSYRIDLNTGDEFEELAKSMNKMNEGLEEKERMKMGFAQYISQHVLDRVVKSKGSSVLKGDKQKMTVLFSDLRDFSNLEEHMTPEQIVTFLSGYFKIMIEIVYKYNGMLYKLIGDAIVAQFSSPNQEKDSVLAAIEMQKTLQELQKKWSGLPTTEIGIGIHTGDALSASIGSDRQKVYTPLGDTVNVASRLEDLSRRMKYPIIISETTFLGLHGGYPSEALGPQVLTGTERSINAFAVMIDTPLLPPKNEV